MINDFTNHWIPSDGYAYISNGTLWTEQIYLGKADNISNWHDTNEEPPEPPVPEEDATSEDYEDALSELGMEV